MGQADSDRPQDPSAGGVRRLRVMTVFGTRPEVIKVAPVIRAMEADAASFETVNVGTGQHSQLMGDFAAELGVRVDHDLATGRPGQTLLGLQSRVLGALDPLIDEVKPDAVLVQGDTTTAHSGAWAGFCHRVPVGHIEAGLRSGRADDPFPEEMHRRQIGQSASWHFAVTQRNADALVAEGVDARDVPVVGNPVVDQVRWAAAAREPSAAMRAVLDTALGKRLIALTTHRRESFGDAMAGNLAALRAFVEARPDVAVVFPVHPNPAVRAAAEAAFAGAERIELIDPLGYVDFVHLQRAAWLIVTDSGGVQEEAPSLGKPVLVIRKTTERPDGVAAGVARLVGGAADAPDGLAAALATAETDGWPESVKQIENPYGDGRTGPRIAEWIKQRASSDPRNDPRGAGR